MYIFIVRIWVIWSTDCQIARFTWTGKWSTGLPDCILRGEVAEASARTEQASCIAVCGHLQPVLGVHAAALDRAKHSGALPGAPPLLGGPGLRMAVRRKPAQILAWKKQEGAKHAKREAGEGRWRPLQRCYFTRSVSSATLIVILIIVAVIILAIIIFCLALNIWAINPKP